MLQFFQDSTSTLRRLVLEYADLEGFHQEVWEFILACTDLRFVNVKFAEIASPDHIRPSLSIPLHLDHESKLRTLDLSGDLFSVQRSREAFSMARD